MNTIKKAVAAALVAALVPAFAAAQEAPLKIGVVSFLSGAAAGPFGVPARNSAEIMFEMLNAGKVMSREQLEHQLYRWGREVDSNAIEVHVHHLRRKLGPGIVNTVRGVGYIVAAASGAAS